VPESEAACQRGESFIVNNVNEDQLWNVVSLNVVSFQHNMNTSIFGSVFKDKYA